MRITNREYLKELRRNGACHAVYAEHGNDKYVVIRTYSSHTACKDSLTQGENYIHIAESIRYMDGD